MVKGLYSDGCSGTPRSKLLRGISCKLNIVARLLLLQSLSKYSTVPQHEAQTSHIDQRVDAM